MKIQKKNYWEGGGGVRVEGGGGSGGCEPMNREVKLL